jgi:hypothetical protein
VAPAFEVTITCPTASEMRRSPSPEPIAVRIDVRAGSAHRACGFFRGTQGAERHEIPPQDALAWVQSGVHGTMNAPAHG